MGIPAFKNVPVELYPDLRLMPPPVETGPSPLPKNWPKIPAANIDVEIVETFAHKFLRVGFKVATVAARWGNVLALALNIPGDTPERPHRNLPIVDQPPQGKGLSQWLDEMAEMARLAALIATKQSEISRHRQNGQEHLARQAEQDLAIIQIQVQTNLESHPTLDNRLRIKASAGDASVSGGDTSSTSKGGLTDEEYDALHATVPLTTIRTDLAGREVIELAVRLQDERASFEDQVTLFATAPARFMGSLGPILEEMAEETPDSITIEALRNPLVPADVRVIQMLFVIQAQDDRARAAMERIIADTEGDMDANAAGVRAVYREFVPGADKVLAAVDDYLQGQAQNLVGANAMTMGELTSFIMRSRAVDMRFSLSLLVHGPEIMQWFRMNRPSGNDLISKVALDSNRVRLMELRRASKTVLETFHFTPEQQGMVVDLMLTYPFLILDVEAFVLPFLRTDRALADLNLRRLYIANKPMGEYVLAEYDRQNNLPEVRAKRAFDSAIIENGRDKAWRKAMFPLQQSGGQAALTEMLHRALMHADNGDEQQLKVLAGQWIDIAMQNPKDVVQRLRGYSEEQDPDGFHVFSFFNVRSYNPITQPLGSLLPHEQRFWGIPPSESHSTIQMLHQIERVHPNDFRMEYAALTDPEWFAEANAVIRDAATRVVGDVDGAAVRELMRRAVLDPQLHAALLYWGASKPSDVKKYFAWSVVPERVAAILNYSRSRRSHIAGNIMELVLRSATYDGVAEMNAIRMFAGVRGNWVHILPNDYARRHQVADLLVIGRAGEQTMVEVKNHLYRGRSDLPGVEQSLTKAASQLESTSRDYPLADHVIYLRLAIPHSSQLPEEIRLWIQSHLNDDPRFQNITKAVVETANAQDRDDKNVSEISGPRHARAGNGNSRLAGPMEAMLLADRLVEVGIVRAEHRNLLLARIAQAPKSDVDHVLGLPPNRWRLSEALDRYGLMPVVKPYLVHQRVVP